MFVFRDRQCIAGVVMIFMAEYCISYRLPYGSIRQVTTNYT